MKEISLLFISFPALPKLLSSTRDIVTVDLQKKYLHLATFHPEPWLSVWPCYQGSKPLFQSATFHPDQIDPPPITRSVLPALTDFDFRGPRKYLEALVARVYGHQLSQTAVVHWDQVGDTLLVRRSRFIHRSGGPRSILIGHAQVNFYCNKVTFCWHSHANHPSSEPGPGTFISYDGDDWQGYHVAQALGQSSSSSNVVHLKIKFWDRAEDIGYIEWQPLLHQFSIIQTLYVSRDLARYVALELEDIARGMFAGSLQSLDLICLESQPASSIQNYVASRQLSGRPVTIVGTEAEFDERLKCYVSK